MFPEKFFTFQSWKYILGNFITPNETGDYMISSLGRYVFGSEISYNKAPPPLPGLAC